jgi:hypothetical protein
LASSRAAFFAREAANRSRRAASFLALSATSVPGSGIQPCRQWKNSPAGLSSSPVTCALAFFASHSASAAAARACTAADTFLPLPLLPPAAHFLIVAMAIGIADSSECPPRATARATWQM